MAGLRTAFTCVPTHFNYAYVAEKACDKMARLRRLTSVQVLPASPRQQHRTCRVVHVSDAASSNITATSNSAISVTLPSERFILLRFSMLHDLRTIISQQSAVCYSVYSVCRRCNNLRQEGKVSYRKQTVRQCLPRSNDMSTRSGVKIFSWGTLHKIRSVVDPVKSYLHLIWSPCKIWLFCHTTWAYVRVL